MSAMTSRPRVRGLSVELIRAANTRVSLASEVFEPLVEALSLGSTEASAHESITLQPLASLRRRFEALRQDSLGVLRGVPGAAPGHRVAIATAVALGGTGYVLEQGTWEDDLRRVRNATTVADAERAAEGLIRKVENEHARVVERSLERACADASRAAGFENVDTRRASEGCLRVVATDPHGRALVSEIHFSSDRDPALVTEVVGVVDGSCERILDAFDRALEARGVRVGEAPLRQRTGGVPHLDAAREFVRRIGRSPLGRARRAPSFGKEESHAGSHRSNRDRGSVRHDA